MTPIICARAPDRLEHPLHQREELVEVGEGNLGVELGQLLQAIGAQILVAEADGDLVVAVEAGHHQDLLVELRRLGQRVEASRLQARRHEKIACALRRRLAEDRRLDVEEAGGLHHAAHHADHPGAQGDVLLQVVAAQIEPAVAQAQRLVHVLLVELEGQRRAARDDLERIDLDLDLAGRKPGVDRLGRARHDLALGAQHELVANLMRGGEGFGRPLRVDHELADAGAVAQVDEDEPAVIAARICPAREDQLLADLLGANLAAHEVTPFHASSSSSLSYSTDSSGLP